MRRGNKEIWNDIDRYLKYLTDKGFTVLLNKPDREYHLNIELPKEGMHALYSFELKNLDQVREILLLLCSVVETQERSKKISKNTHNSINL